MGTIYKRDNITGKRQKDGTYVLNEADVKKINDTFRMLFLHAFGNIDIADLKEDVGKKLDISDNKTITQVNSDINTIKTVDLSAVVDDINSANAMIDELNGNIALVDQAEKLLSPRVDALETQSDSFAQNITLNTTDIDNLEERADALALELGNKVSNNTFSSYTIQTADLIASKVSSENFETHCNDQESWMGQTAIEIASKVADSDFQSYKTQTATDISSKVANSDFQTYKTQTATLIGSKVDSSTFSSYQTQTANQISSKVATSDFNTYKTQTATEIASKVSNSAFTSYQSQTANAIESKVDDSEFSTYKTQTSTIIASKVSNDTFSSYQVQTANEIGSKISSDDYYSYMAQNEAEIMSKVSSEDFATYQTQTDQRINLVVTKNPDGSNKVNADNIITAINLSPGTVQIVAEKMDMGNVVMEWANLPSDVAKTSQIPTVPDTSQFINATTATSISQNVVSTSTIACDQLTTPTGHNPIIKLFSATNQAAIDATANMNSGTGTAIRLKWDNSNYVYVSTNQITFYLGGVGVFNVTPSGVFFNGVNISGGNVVPVFG